MEAGLNLIGLALNVLGGLVIFKWGPPQPSFEREDDVSWDNPKHEARVEALEWRYRFMSRIGLIMIILGFMLQLPAAVRPVVAL